MATTTSSPSSEAQRDKLALTQRLYEEAKQHAEDALHEHHILAYDFDHNEETQATQADLDRAKDAAELAAQKVPILAVGVETETRKLAEAEEREREERRAEIADEAQAGDKERAAARKRLANALASATAAFESFDRANATAATLRAEAIRLRDLDRQEGELTERYRARIAELEATKVQGWEPNYASLELRFERELADLREAARAEAESLAPPADDETIREIIDAHAELLPRLVDTATRRALAQGHEYIVDGPRHVSEMLPRGSVGRFYSDGEIEHARSRHDAFLRAIRLLGGPGESIGDGTRPTVRPI